MRHKALLLGTVSAAALVAAASSAQAQDATDGITVSVEGAALFGPNNLAEDKLGTGVLLPGSGGEISYDENDNTGWRAAFAVQKQLDPLWDVKLALALNHQFETTSSLEFAYSTMSGGSGSTYAGLFETKNDFDFETADLEVGFTPDLDGPIDFRVFGGVRGMHYNDTFDKLGTYEQTYYSGGSATSGGGSFTYALDQSSAFYGAGPRVGFEASSRFGDSMFGLTSSVAGALLLGRAEHNYSLAYDFTSGVSGGIPFPTVDSSVEEWGWVTDFEASLGLDLYINDMTKLTVGGRVERVGTLSEFSTGTSGGDSASGERLTYGPTLKLQAQF